MTRKRLYRALALCLALSLCLGMTACFGGKTDPTTGANMTYTVQVKTEGGLALEKIGVYVYEDSTLADLVAVEKTDETGMVSFDAPQSDSYVAVLKDVPEGYGVEESYPLTGETTEIVLKVQMVEADLNNATYTLGGAMGDFTFTAADGKAYKLSELLQTKKAVVLNFWYLNCEPCKMEFPYLQEAYAQYSDSVAVLAMNPVDGDDASIQAFAQELGLTTPTITGKELAVPHAIATLSMDASVTRSVGFTLLDCNGHMNNTYYMDWVADLLPSDFHRDHPAREFTVCYMNEAREGDEIGLSFALSDGPTLTVDAQKNSDRIFSAQVLF